MIRSQQVAEWKNEARVEGRIEAKIEDLLEVLRTRCGSVPEELAATVRGTSDLGLLTRWLILAAQADSLDVFRQQAQI
jgi:hypothetical protein